MPILIRVCTDVENPAFDDQVVEAIVLRFDDLACFAPEEVDIVSLGPHRARFSIDKATVGEGDVRPAAGWAAQRSRKRAEIRETGGVFPCGRQRRVVDELTIVLDLVCRVEGDPVGGRGEGHGTGV